MDSSSLSHTRYKCQYHIVFIPKYRKRIMYGRLKADVREIIKKLCDYRNIEIVEGAVCADHVHLCLSIPPSEKVSDTKDCSKPVEVGDYAWIGAGATVLPGVRVGHHAVIGASSVVTKDVPDYAVAVGNPARVVKILDKTRFEPNAK